jgi:hypothetical protein
VEASIRQALSGSSSGVCATPATPPTFAMTTGMMGSGTVYTQLPGVDYFQPLDPNDHPHQVLGQTQLALIKAAFLCDLTRVATFSWASGSSWVAFPTTFDGVTLTSISGNPVSVPHNPPLSQDPATHPDVAAWWSAIDRFYAQQSSLAIQSLAAAVDVDGNSLLDNTIVVYLTEQSRRWDHNQQNMPLLVFGGKNTRLKGGTFLKITDGPLRPQGGASGSTGNRPFNDFWMALAPAFGVDLGPLGTASQHTGPLPGLLA